MEKTGDGKVPCFFTFLISSLRTKGEGFFTPGAFPGVVIWTFGYCVLLENMLQKGKSKLSLKSAERLEPVTAANGWENNPGLNPGNDFENGSERDFELDFERNIGRDFGWIRTEYKLNSRAYPLNSLKHGAQFAKRNQQKI